MKNIHVTKDPVTLEGYQAILKPSKFGYSLKAVVGSDVVEALETERADCLKWAESKLKNPKRSTCRPEPWEEVADGKYIIKFSWAEDKRPPVVVDTEGTPITNIDTPVYEGPKLSLAFIKSLIYCVMALPMVLVLSYQVYKSSVSNRCWQWIQET